ncbi:MAG: GxxExxY protein [Candidatus Sumerlaeia bacterium]|nr:GxxExxY protein [Candidatus Sumerlaeia bacterium]
MSKLIHESETYQIRGTIFEVYREQGCGFLEPVYQECLEIELGLRGIPFTARQQVPLAYKGHQLKQAYIPDFICFERVIVEIKAVDALTDQHRAQLFNYLKATGLRVGLLVNFGAHPEVAIERVVYGSDEAG